MVNPLMGGNGAVPSGRVTREMLHAKAAELNREPWAIEYGWRWHVEDRNGRAFLCRADNMGQSVEKQR